MERRWKKWCAVIEDFHPLSVIHNDGTSEIQGQMDKDDTLFYPSNSDSTFISLGALIMLLSIRKCCVMDT